VNSGKTLFAQLMDFLPWSTFTRSPKASTPPTCKRQKRCSTSWSELLIRVVRMAAPGRPNDPPVRTRRSVQRRTDPLPAAAANGRNRRNLAVGVRSVEGPFTIRFADFRHRAVQAGGLLSGRSTPRQAA
jgi:hypothetical protein